MKTWKDLPDSSRVWIYQCNRPMMDEVCTKIKSKAADFVSGWNSHGSKLNACVEIFYNTFIVFFVDESVATATGCSIDKSVHFIVEVEKEHNIFLMDRMMLTYKKGDEMRFAQMPIFEEMVKDGVINADTIVFNNLVDSKAAFEKHWEVPLKESWHGQML